MELVRARHPDRGRGRACLEEGGQRRDRARPGRAHRAQHRPAVLHLGLRRIGPAAQPRLGAGPAVRPAGARLLLCRLRRGRIGDPGQHRRDLPAGAARPKASPSAACRWRASTSSPTREPCTPSCRSRPTTASCAAARIRASWRCRRSSLGHTAIGIADRNTLAGVVRAYAAIKEYYEEHPAPRRSSGSKLLVGARLETRDGYSLLAYPTDLEAYKRLSRLLTVGNRQAAKGECELTFDDLASHAEGILAIVLPPRRPRNPAFRERLRALARLFGDRCYLAGTMLFRGDDARAPGAARQSRRHDGDRPGRHQRRALSRARAAGAARRGDRHSAGLHRRRAGLPPLRQRRAPPQGARGDGAAVPPPSARHRAHAGDRRALPASRSTSSPTSIRSSTRAARRRWTSSCASPGRARHGAIPTAFRHDVAKTIRHEFALIESKKIAPYFLTVHEIVEQGPRDGHPLPGPRLGRQFGRLLLPRHHRGGSQRRPRSCSSASCPTSATSRPTSTSISSTSGARK